MRWPSSSGQPEASRAIPQSNQSPTFAPAQYLPGLSPGSRAARSGASRWNRCSRVIATGLPKNLQRQIDCFLSGAWRHLGLRSSGWTGDLVARVLLLLAIPGPGANLGRGRPDSWDAVVLCEGAVTLAGDPGRVANPSLRLLRFGELPARCLESAHVVRARHSPLFPQRMGGIAHCDRLGGAILLFVRALALRAPE